VRPDTTIRLGQLINDPLNPQFPIAKHPLPLEPEDIIDGTPKEKVEYTIESRARAKGKLGLVIVNFLNFCIGSSHDKQATHTYKIEKVFCQSIDPNAHYVQMSMKQPEVIRYLEQHRHSVYMVVGIQIAQNAKVILTRRKNIENSADIGPLGLALVGSPIDGKVGGSISSKESVTQSETVIGDFVVAYRLRKCYYHRKSGVASIDTKLFVKGAKLYNDHDTDHKTQESTGIGASTATEIEVIVPDNISTLDTDARSLKIQREAVGQGWDDEECEIIFLSHLHNKG
jgi:hypothetical protein